MTQSTRERELEAENDRLTKLLLRIAPLLADAADALEIETPSLRVAAHRIRLTRELIRA
jgi:hypothetical protein